MLLRAALINSDHNHPNWQHLLHLAFGCFHSCLVFINMIGFVLLLSIRFKVTDETEINISLGIVQ